MTPRQIEAKTRLLADAYGAAAPGAAALRAELLERRADPGAAVWRRLERRLTAAPDLGSPALPDLAAGVALPPALPTLAERRLAIPAPRRRLGARQLEAKARLLADAYRDEAADAAALRAEGMERRGDPAAALWRQVERRLRDGAAGPIRGAETLPAEASATTLTAGRAKPHRPTPALLAPRRPLCPIQLKSKARLLAEAYGAQAPDVVAQRVARLEHRSDPLARDWRRLEAQVRDVVVALGDRQLRRPRYRALLPLLLGPLGRGPHRRRVRKLLLDRRDGWSLA
ncbi:MAG: hypothetical protein AAF192_21190 [Pseudomonadota bacterium]